nr:murein biosynthesis integral membrane protein MurJ [Tessaracoccus sp. OS52]
MVSASALMASGTLVSRALGLVRVMLIAFILGNGTRQADMLAVATMVPNSLYILFAGGALNTVLVPQIVRAIKNDADGGEAYTNRIMTAFLLIVAAVAVVVTICAPLITQLYSSEDWRAPGLAAQYGSMVALTYLTLPQVFFYGAFFLLGQVLNARDRFGPMMWAPIANNVISVLVLSIYLFVWGSGGDRGAAFTTGQILLLGIGSTVGIAAQSLVLLPYLRKVGFRFRPRFDLKGTGLGKTFSLTKWTMGFVAVNQVVLVIVTRLATSATAGGAGAGYDVYTKAHLIWILPHSLITVSLATAMLPNASRLAAAADFRGVAEEATKTIRLALILIVPAAVGFFVLADPIAALLFGHGQGNADADWVAWALMGFAIGLIPFTVQFVCLRTYYALEDTRTPFFLQLAIAGANALLAILLVWAAADPGLVAAALALAYSVAYLVGVFLSWQVLKRQVPDLDGGVVVMHVVRLLLGAALGGAAAWLVARLLTGMLGDGVLGTSLAILAGLAIIAAGYLLVSKSLRVREFRSLSDLVNTVLRRRGSRPARALPAEDGDDGDDGSSAGTDPADEADAHRYSATTVAGGLTEDLMPTQLTPALKWDERAEDFIVETPAPTPPAPGPAAPPGAGPVPAIDGGVGEAPGFLSRDDDEPDEWAEHEDFIDDSLAETRVRPPHPSFTPAAPEPQPTPEPEPLAEPGMLLSTRFRTDALLASRAGIETWRAHDLVLSRDVVAHVLREGDPRIPDVLDAARKGAVATDSRFLRVLDAVDLEDHEGGIGAYVVCEFTAGKSLREILAFGPLSTLESAWIVRELADALTGMHSQGLFHEHLNPDNVILTNSGDVKLIGFGVESAISPEPRAASWTDREAADVRGLAKLLYATLVQRWPGGNAYDLEAAPIIAGEPASPHIVRSGVSPALDRITTATLTQRGAAAERRISTASQLAGALSEVLGTADASSDLEHRVRQAQGPRPKRAASLLAAAPGETLTGQLPDQLTSTRFNLAAGLADGTTREHAIAHEQALSGPPPFEPLPDADYVEPVTDPDAASGRRRSTRPALWLLVAFVLAALVISLVIVAVNNARDNGAQDPATTPSGQVTSGSPADPSDSPDGTPAGPHGIVAGSDFDPEADGGNDEENPDSVPLAFDGDPATGWSTLRYHNNPALGGLKPGVGIVLDLGEVKPIAEVELQFEAPGSTVELRVPADAAAESAPMDSESEWSVVATQADAPASTALAPVVETSARFVLVYLTELPEVSDARYLAQLNEVTVSG